MNFAECLPAEVSDYVGKLNGVRELRLRNGKGIRLNVDGKWFWLGKNALLTSPERALRWECLCDDFVKRACNQSVFAYEKMLAQGFFTLSDGTRIGVCGIVGANSTFQSYTSLCVRTAKFVTCVEQDFCDSVVVAGPPGSGKTTYLRDLACRLSQRQNVVVADERGELSCCNGFSSRSFCDVFQYASKAYAFEVAVRTMAPDWLVCDELSENDLSYLPCVAASGVKLAASIHAGTLDELKMRLGKHLNFFSYAVLLQKDTFAQNVVEL